MSREPEDPDKHRVAPYHLITWLLIGLAFVLVLGLASLRLDHQPDTSRDYGSRSLPPEPEPVLLPAPPVDDEYMPCGDCHEDEPPNTAVRALEDEHEATGLDHGDLWCMHCHDTDQHEMLRLADEQLVAFEDSWRLCTQCHGEKLADWRAGVHGKRTGHWWGPKEYRTCVACHEPHAPAFGTLKAKPPPVRTEQIRLERRQMLEVSDVRP